MKRIFLGVLAASLLTAAVFAAWNLKRPDHSGADLIEVLRSRLSPGSATPAVASGETAAASLKPGSVASAETIRAHPGLDPEVRRFYEARGFQPAWLEGGIPSPGARAVLEALRRADEEGLDSRAYPLEALERSAGNLNGRWTRAGADAVADFDLLLTATFLHYASDVARGRIDPRKVNPEWHWERANPDFVKTLDDAVRANRVQEVLSSLPPPHPQYAGLRSALAAYRAASASGGWPDVPASAALRVGARGSLVVALRRRLAASGDLRTGDEGGDRFDQRLGQALRAFQKRHGLEETGAVDGPTREQLGRSLEARIQQILINMERWRWIPRDLGSAFLLVNLPGFDLVVQEGERSILRMRVVAGKEFSPTPLFSDRITQVVLNPSWNIPDGIARDEVLPAMLEDRSYQSKNSIRIFDDYGENARAIPLEDLDRAELAGAKDRKLPFVLRQDPGPLNPLGRIKFMMPNPFDIYLHDTPADHLFRRADRALSHGCIRVEKPLELAEYLLAGTTWNRERLAEAIETGESQTIDLPKPFPVHILYLTSWAEEDGTVDFREDMYGFDHLLETSLGLP